MASKLKLLDLDDDALIMIIDKLDHESKLKMMETCKRFEGLIGQIHQFYKNFKFCYKQENFQKMEDTRYLGNIRRKFETVQISSGTYFKVELKPATQEFLANIGARILKIKFKKLSFNKGDFWKLMKTLPKIKELEIKEICIRETDADEKNFKEFELKHLTKLKVFRSTHLGFFFKFVPSSLKVLQLIEIDKVHEEILEKQKHLEELSLIYCKIDDLKFDPENCHIKTLKVRALSNEILKNLSNFLKVQKSVTDFEFGIYEEVQSIAFNYTELLMHLLGLKSLKKVLFSCELKQETLQALYSLKVCNPAVDTLTIVQPPREADLKMLPKLFPNVADLEITWFSEFDENGFYWEFFDHRFTLDLQSINSMKQIRKFEIDYMTEEMFDQLKLDQLQELHITEESDFCREVWDQDLLQMVNWNWRTFISNHSQLKILHIPECNLNVEQLQFALENLPLLKSLEVTVKGENYERFPDKLEELFNNKFVARYKKKQALKMAQLIGENYDRLKHLELNFANYYYDVEAIIQGYLGKHFPAVKFNK
jgi:hypothetical protein